MSINVESLIKLDMVRQTRGPVQVNELKSDEIGNNKKTSSNEIAEEAYPRAALNKLSPNFYYKSESEIIINGLQFYTITIEADGKTFTGTGTTKKIAKNEAAKKALSNLTEINNQKNNTENPRAALSKLIPNFCYKLESETVTIGLQFYTITIEADGKTFTGTGTTKKIAKNEAAKKALSNLTAVIELKGLDKPKNASKFSIAKNEAAKKALSNLTEINNQKSNYNYSIIIDNTENPSAALSKLSPNFCYKLESETVTIGLQFYTLTIEADGKTFTGTGTTKKIAKNEAAKKALSILTEINNQKNIEENISDGNIKLIGIETSKSISKNDVAAEKLHNLNVLLSPDILKLSHGQAEKFGQLVLDKFKQVVGTENSMSNYTALAAIVMTIYNQPQVISVSTGTKCIKGEYLSLRGSVLNDSHAEIVSRRCLLKFLYSQLAMHLDLSTQNQSIFERNHKCAKYPYKLKDGIQFHLFINKVPCGDAQIFSPNNNNPETDNHPNRITRGLLRTKIESGEGAIPVNNSNGFQDWIAIMRGERLLTMSCSDKIARWNVLGVQGSLLSLIIEPIYLDSIIIAQKHPVKCLYEAVYGRIANSIQNLPPPYHLNKPKLAVIELKGLDKPKNASKFSMNWTVNDKKIEVVNMITGKTEDDKISGITKVAFFKRYGHLINSLPGISHLRIWQSYCMTKRSNIDYRIAKCELFCAFSRKKLGVWLTKPIEEDEFALPK